MDVCVVTGDLIFFSAVEGLAGAMGHKARQVTGAAAIGSLDVVVLDYASLPVEAAALNGAFDPLRAVAFIPHVNTDAFAAARAGGIAHVHRRGALAVELPNILALYASDWTGESDD